MTAIVEKDEFPEGITLLEQGEKVQGGVDGPDNRAPTELANRTRWLKNKVAELEKGIVNGAVFVTDITPQSVTDNVGNKVYNEDATSLEECLSTTTNVTVKVLALTGHSKYRPSIKVNGVDVVLTTKPDAPLFEGTVGIVIGQDGIVKAEHEDGAVWETLVEMDTPPLVTTATFKTPYPVGQTEAKLDDTFTVGFTASVPVVGYEIADFGALQASSGSFASAATFNITGRKVADRGNAVQSLGFRIRVKKASGAWSPWYNSTTGGSTELQHVIKLNNLHPTITLGAIAYPAGQLGLKGTESATVNHTITNYDTVDYSSTELTITDPTAYVPAKVVSRLSGSYNATLNNFTVKAKRTANGAETTAATVVGIANVAPVITINTPAARLRSGGNNGTAVQAHEITLVSNQALVNTPSMNPPEGTWVGNWAADAEKKVWKRTLNVHDNMAKGTFSWNNLIATGLAKLAANVVTTNPTYVLGGFVFRTLPVPAFPNREAAIGTTVSDPTKLRCTNLSKGVTGSLNFTYAANLTGALNRYSITGPTGVFNASGNLWRNNDDPNATSNTGGSQQIELEEVI